jgi:NitT/TauT family transport system ATP-binding protein
MSAVIEARGVTFAYGGGSNGDAILRDLDFSTQDGEFVCVLGPSGCGKTTVLRLLAGFDRAGAGEVLVRGKPVAGPGVDRGVVFQGDDSLFTWLTALDNVSFGPKVRGVSARETHDIATHFMNVVGLANHLHKYPAELSGGMRQRIQIARVLVNSPEILLMDEPFGALDAQTRTELQDELARIWAETRKSVVFITHDIMEAILLADRVAVMKSGPGSRIREFVEIDLPRPRQRSHPRFGELYDHINRLIIEEVRAARAAGGVKQ